MTVNNIQEENNRLRARLSSLVTVKPEAAQVADNGDASNNPSSSSIDISALARLQGELSAAKATLLERELELGRLGNSAASQNGIDETRRTLMSRTAALQATQAEVRALNTVINELRTEHESLNRRREVVSRELEVRRSLQASPGDASAISAASRSSGVERTLLELRGLVDGIIKTWEQVRLLPLDSADLAELDDPQPPRRSSVQDS